MTVNPNGTDAKFIALHFLQETGVDRPTSGVVARTIKQTKGLLEEGYTKDEIIATIDHLVSRGVNMYSIGYISSAIVDVTKELERANQKEQGKELRKELEKQQATDRKAVDMDGEVNSRNASKAGRFGVQSRKREKLNFDMFEE